MTTANLDLKSKETLNDLFSGPLVLAFGYLNGAITPLLGDWLGALYDSAANAVTSIAGNLSLLKEVNHVVSVDASTTTNANGGNLSVRAGAKDGAGTNGILALGDTNTSAVTVAASGTKIGAFGVTPVVRPTALTQTYATAATTLANNTSATLTDSSTGAASTTIAVITQAGTAGSADITPTKNAIASLTAQINALQADLLNTKQFLNQAVDQLQALGWLQ